MEGNVPSYEEIRRKTEAKELQRKQGYDGNFSRSITISTTVSSYLWMKAKEHGIGWSEAMRVGISILLAEKGEMQYDNKLNIWRKMNLFRKKAEESLQQIEELTEKLAKREKVTLKKKPKSI